MAGFDRIPVIPEQELHRSDVKVGHGGSLTPLAAIEFMETGDLVARAQYRSWVADTPGVHLMVRSRRLQDIYSDATLDKTLGDCGPLASTDSRRSGPGAAVDNPDRLALLTSVLRRRVEAASILLGASGDGRFDLGSLERLVERPSVHEMASEER